MHTHIIIGGGPAGLMAAEVLSAAGLGVTLYERMPTVGRKLLIAGRGGLNLTHSEPFDKLLSRYGAANAQLESILQAFPPAALIAWAHGLGQETFIGSSGRIFPKSLKASPLLRAWLKRLTAQGVEFKTRHEWRGWNEDGRLIFRTASGEDIAVSGASTILALGGASWPGLGSNGAWVEILSRRGIEIAPLRPANCGFNVNWSEALRTRFAGTPLKGIALNFNGQTHRGEAVITHYGIEGGAIYALSAALRQAIDGQGSALVSLDLRPEQSASVLAEKLNRSRAGESLANFLRKAVNLAPIGINLLREVYGPQLSTEPMALANQIKALPLVLTGTQGLDRAISTAGGVPFRELDDGLMLRKLPGVHVAGEMLDWEAPTGGYLLQASFATAVRAAQAILQNHGAVA